MGAQKAAYYKGSCTGHGTVVSGNVHGVYCCTCNCPSASPKPLSAVGGTHKGGGVLQWEPEPQLPKTPKNPTVWINDICPIIDKDELINHPCTSTNKHAHAGCKNPPPPDTCNGKWLTKEDRRDCGKHKRVSHATTKTVYIMGKLANRYGDPLNGGISGECASLISGASPNVFIGN